MNRLDRDYSLLEQYLWNMLQHLFIGKFLRDFLSQDSCHYVFDSVTPRGVTHALQGGLASTEHQRTVTTSGDNDNK